MGIRARKGREAQLRHAAISVTDVTERDQGLVVRWASALHGPGPAKTR